MLTRCPACQTTFKVTPEQLKLRAGKVRCGKCQSVFNALDTLLDAPPASTPPPAPPSPLPGAARQPSVPPALHPPALAVTAAIPPAPMPAPQSVAQGPAATGAAPATPLAPAAAAASIVEQIDLQPLDETLSASSPASPAGDAVAPVDAPADPLEVRDAAITHGLVAARETTEIPGYNKWAEGAFTAPANIAEPTTRPRWPFVLASLLFAAALAGQAAHHYRAELAVSAPSLRPLLDALCAALECDIPLPRQAEFVSIEASDLQSDAARGGVLVLAATLKNRAPYAQAWPLLEITLTDVQDNAVLRRVLQPAEYLPTKADPTVFPPNADIAVKLWLDTQDVAAAGYRLYVFYP